MDRKEGAMEKGGVLPKETGRVDRKDGGNGEGGISVMECLGGHTFPEQRRVTQLVYTNKTETCLSVCFSVSLSLSLSVCSVPLYRRKNYKVFRGVN